ncbi:response regulator [Hyphococcus luteus]|uniref:histidine kinase n=1 Tax=Hyphococcus luteus TaxID=2058213 RepID=A0A2S7K0Z4_9PROT|nr:hybrid sensor histidine kinase/response regulator [Marinicaulis flavus]PQA86185.1 hypothetical protein CW354_17675 [Marinicaulis flavus]
MSIFGLVISVFCFAAGAGAAWGLSRLKYKKTLAARMAENNAFLSASAQQLRAPLNQIVGSLQALDFQKMGLTQKQEELLGVLNEGSYNLRGALMDILDILDLQADRLKIEPSTVNFKKTVMLLERRFAKRARKKGVALNFDVRKLSHWHFEMDQMRYIQCISTVLSQCIKQTESGAVSVGFDFSGAGKQKHGNLVAVIKDTSAGMDQYMTEAYFSPDKYEFTAEMMDTEGRRLALMLARMLVWKMGGALTVKSSFGNGVVFQLTLPVEATPAPEGEIEETHVKPVERVGTLLANKRILVVDDDQLNLMIMKELLEQGHVGAVETAPNGLEAVKIISKRKCDLVFMDIQMPVLDGLTATREIRKCGRDFSDVPIVALTTAVQEEDFARYKEAGMNDVLPKPVIIDNLFETIERQLVEKPQSKAA